MTTIAELLDAGAATLSDAGVSDARKDSFTLIALALGRDRAFLYSYPEYRLLPNELAKAQEFFKRRAGREPLQYIRGTQEFYGLDFEVSPDVLIPRPETEMLVERAIEILRATGSPRFIDIGTGSGCISVSILANVTSASAVSSSTSGRSRETKPIA